MKQQMNGVVSEAIMKTDKKSNEIGVTPINQKNNQLIRR